MTADQPASRKDRDSEPDMCPLRHCDPEHCGVHTPTGCTWRNGPAAEIKESRP